MTAKLAHLHVEDVRETVRHVRGIVMFLDIEGSVQLIERDEKGTVYRWLDLTRQIDKEVLAVNGGQLLKNLGDGLLIRFLDANAAVRSAFAIQERLKADNANYSDAQKIRLRFGITAGDLIDTGKDVFGHEVNLCARLMSIARSNDIFVTREVREDLDPAFDEYLEDLGEIYIRNLNDPVRAYRISRDPESKSPPLSPTGDDLQPVLAVIPFTQSDDTVVSPEINALSDELTEVLAHSTMIDVVSMLSAKSLSNQNLSVIECGQTLGADYVVSAVVLGRVETSAQLSLELCHTNSHRVLWRNKFVLKNFAGPEERYSILAALAEKIVGAISSGEVRKVRGALLETLNHRTLLTAAITLCSRLRKEDFFLGGQILETLLMRSPDEYQLHAHLAIWHLMRVQQGWSENLDRDAFLAKQAAKKAISLDPENSLALMVEGEVLTHFKSDLALAEVRFNQSLEINPSNAEALLMRGALYAFTDRGEAAVEDVTRALRLAPLQPNKYLYNAIAASAHLTAGNYDRAILLAENSLQYNDLHTSTLRVLIVAHWKLGQKDRAREYVSQLMDLDPDFRVEAYVRRVPSAEYEIGKMIAECLRAAGVPG